MAPFLPQGTWVEPPSSLENQLMLRVGVSELGALWGMIAVPENKPGVSQVKGQIGKAVPTYTRKHSVFTVETNPWLESCLKAFEQALYACGPQFIFCTDKKTGQCVSPEEQHWLGMACLSPGGAHIRRRLYAFTLG